MVQCAIAKYQLPNAMDSSFHGDHHINIHNTAFIDAR